MDYDLKREFRKSVTVSVTNDGKILVKAPFTVSVKSVEEILLKNRRRIESMLDDAEKRKAVYGKFTKTELIKRASEILPEKLRYWEEKTGLHPVGVSVTSAKKRLGSCSSKGRVCFSERLFMYGEDVVDYVIVHELCHLRYMNHSREFYALVEKYLPDYKTAEKKIKNLETE